MMRDEHGVVVMQSGGERKFVEQFCVINGDDVEKEFQHPSHREDELNTGSRRFAQTSRCPKIDRKSNFDL